MSNELMIFDNEEFGRVRMVEIDGKPYAVGSDVAKCLGYKRPNKAISDHCKGILKQSILTNGGRQEMNIIPQRDVIKLLQKSKTMSNKNKQKFKHFLVDNKLIEDKFVIESRKEVDFLDLLEECLRPFNLTCVRQRPVLNNKYFIDCYIPKLNIVIEYDENNHDNYTYEQQEGRQAEIEKELSCRFIRVSDENTNAYNVGIIIKNIIEEEIK